ncbi:MAG: DNA polymerase III subunit gamma/tau [Parvibaculaceae bacterium]|nr:DNA polymerase III subunit gamma/tau [Parvibaculaceae bacterium]
MSDGFPDENAHDEEPPHIPDPDTEPGFGLLGGEGDAPASKSQEGYRVLARKYRPTNFDDLIGQEAMVRTLSNAFESGRIAHAFMLTGVRGVGKTTTARILARALNYTTGTGDKNGENPSIDLGEKGVHCDAIMESRHPDIIEMDAASRTGIDDIREIIESVRYLPTSARYKVYIIDEVHMLSKAAFNGLLKTLEEPPEHVKFIFATTEIRKVPVTVLSRCQRFDLRRLSSEELVGLLGSVCEKEGVTAEPQALAMMARAAEGSARDGLSLLDQAIAHGAGTVKEDDIRDMLGLADRARVFDLFDHLMKGNIADALGELREQYNTGADPAVVLTDLAELCHWLTRLKLVESAADDMAVTETERVRGKEMASSLPVRVLSRTWQMLLKGIAEVQTAAKPIAAAEMVMVRIAYVAEQPSPEDLAARFANATPPTGGGASTGGGGGGSGGGGSVSAMGSHRIGSVAIPQSTPRAMSPAAPYPANDQGQHLTVAVKTFEDLLELAKSKRAIRLAHMLETEVRLVHFEPGRIEIGASEEATKLVPRLAEALRDWTGSRWLVSVARKESGADTVREQEQTHKDILRDEAREDPIVKAVLETFPGAEIVDVRLPFDVEEEADEEWQPEALEGVQDGYDIFEDD